MAYIQCNSSGFHDYNYLCALLYDPKVQNHFSFFDSGACKGKDIPVTL